MAAQKGGKKTTAVRRRRERKNIERGAAHIQSTFCLLYTSPSPRDLSTSRMPSSA